MTTPLGMVTTDENVGGHRYTSSSDTRISKVVGDWASQALHHPACVKTGQKATTASIYSVLATTRDRQRAGYDTGQAPPPEGLVTLVQNALHGKANAVADAVILFLSP